MLKDIRNLINILNQRQRKQLIKLQILIVLMGILETISIMSILPFMTLVGNLSLIESNSFLAKIYQFSNVSTPNRFMFYSGVVSLGILTASTFLSIFTIWKLSMFAAFTGTEISDRLYQNYMKRGWMFHSSNNSSILANKITGETVRITHLVLIPLVITNAKLVNIFFISIALFIYNPAISLVSSLMFFLIYYLFYQAFKKKLSNNGKNITNLSAQRLKFINEGLGGIKEIIILGCQKLFVNKFKSTSKQFSYSIGSSIIFAQVPRYFIELMIFGSMISLIIYLIYFDNNQIETILPTLTIFALAGLKLLPAFQQVYSQISTIQSNMFAFNTTKNDLTHLTDTQSDEISHQKERLSFNNKITLKDVSFKYQAQEKLVLSNINIEIPVNQTIGFVGESGSGKSTLIDIITGLISPLRGKLLIDDTEITRKNIRNWQNNIGLVPQNIHLIDGSIAENIALGFSNRDFDTKQIQNCIYLAHLSELLDSLPDGINSKVGERGVKLSGGQKQRIIIARAFYHNPKVLIFDEATSSLDGITEKLIMNSIDDFGGKKTIILIAHRIKTIKKCNQIFLLDKGKIIDSGTFDQLIKNNPLFYKIAEHA